MDFITGTVQLKTAQIVKAGEVFDGKMQTFERSDVSWNPATLKNVIIGKNQMEGVHCDQHDCTIDNVWWDDVCEDALSVKGGSASSVTTVTGGGARSADDKVIQHNGYGTVKIDGFYGEDISKLYRSCGTCGDKAKKVSVSNVLVVNPGNAVVTVNKNWGDEATLSNIWVKSSSGKVKICQWSQGNAVGEPSMLGDGPSPPLCQYSESDVHINGQVPKASGTSGSSNPTQTSSGSTTSGDEKTGTSVSSSLRGSKEQDTTEQKETSAPSTTSSKSDDKKSDDQKSDDEKTEQTEQTGQTEQTEDNTNQDDEKKSKDEDKKSEKKDDGKKSEKKDDDDDN
eukprot:jgi/Phyca11/19254/fgenesh1_pg.PHYCAscaffold_46_\